jgi:hypothetical protein
MKKMKEKSGTKITQKSSSLVVGVLLLCLEHTHIKSSLSFYTRERERKERSYRWCCSFCPLYQRERERERDCNKSAKRITLHKSPPAAAA